MSAAARRSRRTTPPPTVDLDVEDQGSIVLLRPRSDAGTDWIADACDAPPWAWWGGALAIEPRLVGAIVDGARGDGLTVRGVP